MMRIKKPLLFLLVLTIIFSTVNFNIVSTDAAEPTRPSLQVKKTLAAPIIDGKIDESMWTVNEPLQVKLGNGNFKDAQFGMLWDNSYLYIAVEAVDDNLIYNGDGSWFQQDSMSLFFDPTSHQSAPFVQNDMQIGLVYQPNSTTPKFYFGAAPNHATKKENDILRAIQTTDKGWSAEVAIPWETLEFDPMLTKKLGFDVNVTHRDDKTDAPFSAWSAYNSNSFWNDTTGYGSVILSDEIANGTTNDVLLNEDFNSYDPGKLPFGWTSTVTSGKPAFDLVKDVNGNGKLSYDGSAPGNQAFVLAPVQWDNYTAEADLTFNQVINNGRWASIIVRASSNGVNQYNQMAVRQNGNYEFAYRTPANAWVVPISGKWAPGLTLGQEYTLKIRIVDNNIKEYIKPKDATEYTLLVDKNLDSNILERGKIGLQADQSKVTFDHLKVTRVTADHITMDAPTTLEALTDPAAVTFGVTYSDGINGVLPKEKVKMYSSDESVIKIANNNIYPLKAGKATVKAVYQNAEVEKEITVTPSAKGVAVTSLQHEQGYVLASTGDKINLQGITFNASFNDLTTGTIKGDQLTWTANSDQVVIVDNTITAKRKGVYQLTTEKDGVSAKIMLVVKDAAETDYTLYQQDFTSLADGTMPEGWTTLTGTTPDKVGVKNGAFEINGKGDSYNATGVMLPQYLNMFGNYKIEADLTHVSVNDAARWNSIMYRVQKNSYPYYQMAVRQNATAANGVEFTERTSANAWNVMTTAPFTEAIDANKMYHYTIKAFGNRVQQFINDQLVVDTDLATKYLKGGIALQAAGSLSKIDNIKVTLQTEELPKIVKPSDKFVTVAEPQTKIALAPSVITKINSSADLTKLTEGSLPATAILHVNSALEVTDDKNNKIATLDSVLKNTETKIIPAFSIDDEKTVDPLINYLKSNKVEDAFVLSTNPVLVKKARTAYPIIRGIIEFTNSGQLTEEDLMNIRRTTNSNLSKIIILPEAVASEANVAYLQKKLMTVWVNEEQDKHSTAVDIHKLIQSGPNGIVTDQIKDVYEAYQLYDGNTTLIRKQYISGHRGLPSVAPEDTMESITLAYEKGADFIENDLWLTKDGEIVILHDSTLERTTNGTGKVEDYTLAELKQLKANDQFPTEFPDAKIPTLREYFTYLKGKDADLLMEIKSYKPELVDALAKLIDEMGMENQISLISFIPSQIKVVNEKMPGMTIGLLTGSIAKESDVNGSLRNALISVQNLNTTFNTSYDGLGKNFMEAANHRGLTVWPWTYRNLDDFKKYYLLGVNALTTDYANWASNWAEQITPKETSYQVVTGDSVNVSATIDTYDRQTKDITPEVVLINGQDKVTVSGNTITAKGEGTVHAMLRYTQAMDATNKYDIYTQPITITVKAKGLPKLQVNKTYNLKSFKTKKLVISTPFSLVDLDETSVINDSLLVKTTATLKGTGLKNTKVIINPNQKDAVVDLSGVEVKEIQIDSNNIKEIRGAENVKKWTVASGVDATAINVVRMEGTSVSLSEILSQVK